MRNTIQALQYRLTQMAVTDSATLQLVEQLRQEIDYCLSMATADTLPQQARLTAIAGAILGTDDAVPPVS